MASYNIKFGDKQISFETMRKTTLGYRPVDKDDSEYQYVLISKIAFEDMRRELKYSHQYTKNAIDDGKKAVEDKEYHYKNYIRNITSDWKAEKAQIEESAENEIEKWRDRYNHEVDMNKALRNATRERANRERKMDKHGSGYKIYGWSTFSYKLITRENRQTQATIFNLYKISVQTPYDASLTLDLVDGEIRESLLSGELSLGEDIPGYYDERTCSLDAVLKEVYDNQISSPMVLRRDYKCDYQKGFWEVTLITNFPYSHNGVDE